jgi:hypothetical protein
MKGVFIVVALVAVLSSACARRGGCVIGTRVSVDPRALHGIGSAITAFEPTLSDDNMQWIMLHPDRRAILEDGRSDGNTRRLLYHGTWRLIEGALELRFHTFYDAAVEVERVGIPASPLPPPHRVDVLVWGRREGLNWRFERVGNPGFFASGGVWREVQSKLRYPAHWRQFFEER